MNYLIAFCLFALSACGNTVNNKEVSTYQVSSSQNTFAVTLQSNPTTGYQWIVKQYDQSLLTLTTSQYVPPNTKLIGAPGHIVFNFTIKAGVARPKRLTIQFLYGRPWEPDTGT